MTWVVAVVRVDGAFVSKTKARIAAESGDYANAHATVNTAETCIFGRGEGADKTRAAYRPQNGEFEKAQAIIAWGRENVPAMLDADQGNDYLYNLSVAIKRDYLEPRLTGLAASLMPVHNRDLAKKALAKMNRETLGGSKHFGQVGERIKFLGVTLLHTFRHEGDWGATYITKLLTDSGDVAVWFAKSGPLSKPRARTWTAEELESALQNSARMGMKSPYADLKPGDVTYGPELDLVEYGERVVINATVKKHDERDGIKQTILSRCTVWTPAGVELELAKQARKAEREAKKAAKVAKTTATAQEAA
jgi:hypothetical protein